MVDSSALTSTIQRAAGHDFAPTYRAFLSLHKSWMNCFGSLTLVGTGPADFSGALWAYDVRTRRADGEMTLRNWDISYGAQDPTFAPFTELVEWLQNEAEQLLRDTQEAIKNPRLGSDDEDD